MVYGLSNNQQRRPLSGRVFPHDHPLLDFIMNQNQENTEPEDYWKKFDEAFFNDGYKLANVYLANGLTKENLFKAQWQLYYTIDQLIDSFLNRAKANGKPSACKKGCSCCCHQTVLASPYEIFYLQDFLQKKFMKAPFDQLIERVKSKADRTSKFKRMDDLLRYKEPCPLLHPTEGYCRAYQARPMSCRIYLSSDEISCKKDLESPFDDSIFPKLYDMPLRAGRMMNEGFHARIRKGKYDTLQAFETSIELGLIDSLKPDAFEKWLQGKKIFNQLT